MTSQLILVLDSLSKLSAEMPSASGGRRKISLSDYDQDILSTTVLYQALFQEARRLDDQRIAAQLRQQEAQAKTSREVFAYVNNTHGEALAKRVVPQLSPTQSGSLRKLGQNTQPREVGAEKAEPKSKPAKLDLTKIQPILIDDL